MANIQYYDVILKPVITEKSMLGMTDKKYTFLVHPDSNKTMIKEAVEKRFDGVKVSKVNTMIGIYYTASCRDKVRSTRRRKKWE